MPSGFHVSGSSVVEEKLTFGLELLNNGDAASALQPLREAAEIAPSSADARYLVACALHDLGRRVEAEEALSAALELEPEHASAAHRRGVVLGELQRWPDSIAWLNKAVTLDPDRAVAHRDLGVILLVTGEVEAARAAFARAIEIGPWSLALHNLVDLTRMDGDGPDVERLWKTLSELEAAPDLSASERVILCYALGKAHADRRATEAAAAAWAEGGRLKRAGMAYSIQPVLARWREVARVFDRPLLERLEGTGSPSDRPIVICGLPRSGTTLVEQILSAHPQVLAGGETDSLPRVVQSVRSPRGAWPHWALGLNVGSDCRRLADAYLARLPQPGAGETRVTDKRLENVEALGLLHACLPNGALIYVRRDPRDVAFSCWTTLFGVGQAFTYDLEELAAYLEGNERLMEHWRKVLPEGRLLEVPYEELVSDPETWSRRIVAHCGLDWDDRCLEPHNASRAVTTASVAQVRKPIHTGSVGRWKPYAEAMKPLLFRLPTA